MTSRRTVISCSIGDNAMSVGCIFDKAAAPIGPGDKIHGTGIANGTQVVRQIFVAPGFEPGTCGVYHIDPPQTVSGCTASIDTRRDGKENKPMTVDELRRAQANLADAILSWLRRFWK